MKKVCVFFMICFLAVSGTSFAKSKQYGKPLTVAAATPVSAILDQPEKFLGQRVKVQGMITEVCAKRGCWVYIAGDRPYEKIQIKVTDGEIVFPMSASGRMAEVEGVVQELKLSRQDLLRWKRHLAEERGIAFDPASVKKDERVIRIIGIGAMIKE